MFENKKLMFQVGKLADMDPFFMAACLFVLKSDESALVDARTVVSHRETFNFDIFPVEC
jgi:hypothetical protein